MAVVIGDSGGRLVMFHKFDHTQHGSVSLAQIKAETAVNFKRSTRMLEETVAGGAALQD